MNNIFLSNNTYEAKPIGSPQQRHSIGPPSEATPAGTYGGQPFSGRTPNSNNNPPEQTYGTRSDQYGTRAEQFVTNGTGRPEQFVANGSGRPEQFVANGSGRPEQFVANGGGRPDQFVVNGGGRPEQFPGRTELYGAPPGQYGRGGPPSQGRPHQTSSGDYSKYR